MKGMRLRTVALAMALASGFTVTLGAREKPASQFRKTKPGKAKAPKYKTPKYKAPKYKQHKNKRHT
jgi:hypothetical protein